MRTSADGDETAFRAIFDRHADAIRSYLIARVGPDAGDDLLAETFAEAWAARAKFRADTPSARPWLYGIATIRVRRHALRERRWQEALTRGTRDVGEFAHGEPGDALVSSELRTAIAGLSQREREVLLLVALSDLPVADAARVLGISAVAARTRLRRARRQVITTLNSAPKETP